MMTMTRHNNHCALFGWVFILSAIAYVIKLDGTIYSIANYPSFTNQPAIELVIPSEQNNAPSLILDDSAPIQKSSIKSIHVAKPVINSFPLIDYYGYLSNQIKCYASSPIPRQQFSLLLRCIHLKSFGEFPPAIA
jgi:hypothetical protein